MNAETSAATDAVTAAMRRWVGDKLGVDAGAVTFTRIGDGRSNLTYLVTEPDDASGAVLRRPPLGTLLPSAHDMTREHRILRALQGTTVPVPRILGYCDDTAVSERPFYLMSHVDGHTVDSDAAADRLDPSARRAVGPALARALAALHEVDVDAVGLGDLGRRAGYAERQIRRWSRQWELSKLESLPQIDAIAQRLSDALPPEPDRPALVHGDYNLSNVIVGDEGEIRAVLDWELCTVGHPLADLGTLLTYWPDAPAQATLERDPVPLLPGFCRRTDLVAAYRSARPDVDLAQLPYWTALASWKLAIILQGVYRRWLENPANGGRDAGATPDAVARLAGLAVAALDEGVGE